MILQDEQLESLAQALAFEKALTVIEGTRVRMFGADIWWQWDLTTAALIEVVDRVIELWGDE